MTRTSSVWPPPGSIVSVPFGMFFRHRGVVSDRWFMGKPTVISNSRSSGRVREEQWDVFSDGLAVAVDHYPTILPPHEVLRRARLLFGTPYDLVRWNCDHFVRHLHGLPVESPQLRGALLVLAVGTTLVLARG